MIAKIKTRTDFGGIVNYANDQKNKKKSATLLAHEGVCTISNKAIADFFQIQASMRPKVKSPVKHVSLAFSSQDISRFPDNEEGDALMVEIAKKWMEQMGIRNTQYIIARHHDTKHPHCHLVFNRIDITQHSAKVVEAQITVKFRTSNAKFIHTKGYTTNFIRVLSMIKTHIYALTFERTNKVIPRTRIYLRIKN